MTAAVQGRGRGRLDGSASGLLLGIVSSASFGTSGSFARSLSGVGWTPAASVTARIGIAALLLAVPAVLALRGSGVRARSSWSFVLAYGLVAAASQVCYFHALEHLSVGVALLLEYQGVLLVVLWTWIVHGERPRRRTVAGAAVALVGLALVLDLGGPQRLDGPGLAWAGGAAVGLAAYYVLSGHGAGGLPAVTLASAGMGVGAAVLLSLGLLGAVPLHAPRAAVQIAGTVTSWIVPVAGLSLVGAVVAYVTGIAGARRLGPRLASFVGLTEVLFAVLFAWLFLGELPTWLQLAGGVLVLAGVALVRSDPGGADAGALPAASDTIGAPDPLSPLSGTS